MNALEAERGSSVCSRCDGPMFVTLRGIDPESGVSRPKRARCLECGETWNRDDVRRGDR